VKNFVHINATTIDDAVFQLRKYSGRAVVIAGGTDILGKMKDRILPDYPEAVLNIKNIEGLNSVAEDAQVIRIGSLTKLSDLANNPLVNQHFPALSEAARRTASPNLREMGTLGGNICQDIRCWYYRSPENRFPCLRKGGGRCYAIMGDNRYHSIFGGSVEEGCYAVHPSDTAPALVALDASIVTSKRTVKAEDFFLVQKQKTTILEADEIVTEIVIPKPLENNKNTFIKFAIRKSIDFPIVNCAASLTLQEGAISAARICLNAVAVVPQRAVQAEELILGQSLDENLAERAGEAAVADAKPMTKNAYLIQIAKTLVKRSILACV
jgi:xanthine dehydrogenase YagS FAD-binding subunit